MVFESRIPDEGKRRKVIAGIMVGVLGVSIAAATVLSGRRTFSYPRIDGQSPLSGVSIELDNGLRLPFPPAPYRAIEAVLEATGERVVVLTSAEGSGGYNVVITPITKRQARLRFAAAMEESEVPLWIGFQYDVLLAVDGDWLMAAALSQHRELLGTWPPQEAMSQVMVGAREVIRVALPPYGRSESGQSLWVVAVDNDRAAELIVEVLDEEESEQALELARWVAESVTTGE